MGLSITLSNALSGMDTTQKGLEVLSRNVSNAGSPGYHRQSLQIVDQIGASSTYARAIGVDRAFSAALQRNYSDELSNLGYADQRATILGRLEAALGKPGDATSLDTVYQNFENALHTLATSPDDFATRALVVSSAQSVVESLNALTREVQGLRTQTEDQIANHTVELNRMLSSLDQINQRLSNHTTDETSRNSLLDERDRLVSGIAELLDVNVTYRSDDSVALMTKTGLGLIDNGATYFEFERAGQLNAGSQHSIVDAESGVGSLKAFTASGLIIDVVDQGLIQSGRLAGLFDMRDRTLVQAQAQLDEIAAGLSLALSTNNVAGTVVAGPPDGFSVDLATIQPGNDFEVRYEVNGTPQTVRVVRVDDTSKLPIDTVAPDGARVIGLDFSGGIGAVATALNTALGTAITVSNPAGTTLQIVDDGAGNTSNILSLNAHPTSTAEQGGGLGLSLFVDASAGTFTNSIDGTPQKLGYAGRIAINTNVLANNSLLVQYTAGGSLGDTARVNHIISNIETRSFHGDAITSSQLGTFRLSGTARQLITQTLNYQGNSITAANHQLDSRQVASDALGERIQDEYGVNIDEEMARLLELQTAYAASARVVSIVQELLDTLIRI